MEWPEAVEPVEEWVDTEPALAHELPAEFAEPMIPSELWFDEPQRDSGPRHESTMADPSPFDDLPDDLFAEPQPESAELPPLEPEPEVAEAPVEATPVPPLEPTPADETPTNEPPSPEEPAADSPESDGDVAEEELTGDGDEESHILSAPPPRYPASARAQGKQGVVWLSIHVNAAGKVISVGVQTTSGHPVLDEAARQSVKTWRFRPRKSGEAEVRTFVESVIFDLHDR